MCMNPFKTPRGLKKKKKIFIKEKLYRLFILLLFYFIYLFLYGWSYSGG